MHLITRNVNTAFATLVSGIHTGKIPTHVCASRYGEVAQVEEPVILTYTHPRERVLFNGARDANPFFHLYEALWMLAGRDDVAPLVYYNKRMREFSDDGETFNGAYGYRWKNYIKSRKVGIQGLPSLTKHDQLTLLIDHLRRKPESRRAVLQMWNVEDDLLKIDESKDVCCNLSVLFAIERADAAGYPDYLNMTVFNRSNDLIWGMLGANAVHFSILQEYVAAHIGLEVGKYHQITNNLHVYTDNWKPEEWLAEQRVVTYEGGYGDPIQVFPLIQDPATFDKELGDFVEMNYGGNLQAGRHKGWIEPFLGLVAQPMLHAFHAHKRKEQREAERWLGVVYADDWRIAAQQWVDRREEAKRARK